MDSWDPYGVTDHQAVGVACWVKCLPPKPHFWGCGYVGRLAGSPATLSRGRMEFDKGLISGCMAGGGGWIEGAFTTLNVTFVLSDA